MTKAQQLRDRSQRFALAIIAFCDTLPPDPRTQHIATQLHDAANSMAMNYRAACRGRSHAEFVAKICITVEEADEAQGWLDTLIKSGKASGDHVQRLFREATELLNIFAASKRTALKRRRRDQPPNPESPNP
jgi:four helix bundle protein